MRGKRASHVSEIFSSLGKRETVRHFDAGGFGQGGREESAIKAGIKSDRVRINY